MIQYSCVAYKLYYIIFVSTLLQRQSYLRRVEFSISFSISLPRDFLSFKVWFMFVKIWSVTKLNQTLFNIIIIVLYR